MFSIGNSLICSFENTTFIENSVISRILLFESTGKIRIENSEITMKETDETQFSNGGFSRISNTLNIVIDSVTIHSSFGTGTTLGIAIIDQNDVLQNLQTFLNFQDEMNVLNVK